VLIVSFANEYANPRSPWQEILTTCYTARWPTASTRPRFISATPARRGPQDRSERPRASALSVVVSAAPSPWETARPSRSSPPR
jgi:hypothetical protein